MQKKKRKEKTNVNKRDYILRVYQCEKYIFFYFAKEDKMEICNKSFIKSKMTEKNVFVTKYSNIYSK